METVRLNIGGRHFETLRTTLCTNLAANSLFARLLDPANTSLAKTDSTGAFFFDRDGKLFHHVLNYLRHGVIDSDVYITNIAVRDEFAFWGVDLSFMSAPENPRVLAETLRALSHEDNIAPVSTRLETSSRIAGFFADTMLEQWGDKMTHAADAFKLQSAVLVCDGPTPVKSLKGYISQSELNRYKAPMARQDMMIFKHLLQHEDFKTFMLVTVYRRFSELDTSSEAAVTQAIYKHRYIELPPGDDFGFSFMALIRTLQSAASSDTTFWHYVQNSLLNFNCALSAGWFCKFMNQQFIETCTSNERNMIFPRPKAFFSNDANRNEWDHEMARRGFTTTWHQRLLRCSLKITRDGYEVPNRIEQRLNVRLQIDAPCHRVMSTGGTLDDPSKLQIYNLIDIYGLFECVSKHDVLDEPIWFCTISWAAPIESADRPAKRRRVEEA